MKSQFLLKPIPMARILEIANCHYQDVIPIIDANAANSVNLSVPVGNQPVEFIVPSIGNYDFIATHLVGTYTTVVDNGAGGVIDDGVPRLLFNLNLGGWNRDLARTSFPASQFFTPGRVRHPSATNNTGANQCAPSSNLFIPRPLPMLLLKSQPLTLRVQNSASAAQIVTCSLAGWRVTLNEKKLQEVIDSIEAKERSQSAALSGR
jgi:hypothetical protein